MAKTVVFVVLPARTERTKDTLKGIPLRIPRRFSQKFTTTASVFLTKKRRCERFAEVVSAKLRWQKV